MNNCWSSVLLLMSCFLSGRSEHVDNMTDVTLEILTDSFKKYIKNLFSVETDLTNYLA